MALHCHAELQNLMSVYPKRNRIKRVQIPRCARDDAARHLARSWYSPVFGFTRILSPVPMNSGTFTVAPFSSFAGFCDAVFVAVFMTGDVSTTSSVSEFGKRMPTGLPS